MLFVGASQYAGMASGTANTVFSSHSLLNINWTETSSIPSGLEQLFQNITLSMLSNNTLTYVAVPSMLPSADDITGRIPLRRTGCPSM